MKYITATIIGLMLLSPLAASAQTVQQSPEYRATLIQLIAALQQEVLLLQKQLILAQQDQAQGSSQSTTTPIDATQTAVAGATIEDMPQLQCTLAIGNEGVSTVKHIDSQGNVGSISSITAPDGTFAMTWWFPEGATGTLSSDAGESGTLSSNSGTRLIKTQTSVTYTLSVAQDGFEPATCSITATHQQ